LARRFTRKLATVNAAVPGTITKGPKILLISPTSRKLIGSAQPM
jgi:hypothetical protein